MNGVEVSSEVADALCALMSLPNWEYKLIADLYEKNTHEMDEPTAIIKKYFIKAKGNLIFMALANGWEIKEVAPEEKVREMFNGERPKDYDVGEVCAYRKGISQTLEAFKIKIEGVNA